jgi:hypothetical protein
VIISYFGMENSLLQSDFKGVYTSLLLGASKVSVILFNVLFVCFGFLYWKTYREHVRTIRVQQPGRTQLDTLGRVDWAFDLLEPFLPLRLVQEDVGDARELISKLVTEGAPTWLIYEKLCFSIGCIIFNSIRDRLSAKRHPADV